MMSLSNHHQSTTVLLGLVIHSFFDGIAIASGFHGLQLAGLDRLPGHLPAQDSRGLHRFVGNAGRRTKRGAGLSEPPLCSAPELCWECLPWW